MIRHPGQGSLAMAIALVIEDANRGRLGRLKAHQAVELIINRQNGFCCGKTGWAWGELNIGLGSGDAEFLSFDVDAGPWGHRRYFNWAADEAANSGATRFLFPEEDFGQSISDDTTEVMIKTGILPGQKILIRGGGWTSVSYEGEHDAGWDAETIYIEPAEISEEHLIGILEMNECMYQRKDRRVDWYMGTTRSDLRHR